MYVKRVYRSNVRDALAEAREQLGPGALVLSTELVPARGWRGWLGQRVVRLTAAADRGIESDGSDELVEAEAGVPGVSAGRPDATETRQISRRSAAVRAGMVARLVATGLDRSLADAVVARMTDAECRGASERVLRHTLAAEMAAVCARDDEYAKYEVFVGPPGAGKTSTIAKIVAQERAGGRSLGLVAADAFRAGAIEQLRTYATVLNVPFRAARSAGELSQALVSQRQTALIDTAGCSADNDTISSIFDVLQHKRGVRTHLVIAADTSAPAARRILDRYAAVKPSRVVITKLDETDSAMPLVGALRDAGLPISYLTAGQRVPEDLWRATPAALAAALLREPASEVLEERPCR
jgi:flagellar biosynthesis protein FlhF